MYTQTCRRRHQHTNKKQHHTFWHASCLKQSIQIFWISEIAPDFSVHQYINAVRCAMPAPKEETWVERVGGNLIRPEKPTVCAHIYLLQFVYKIRKYFLRLNGKRAI